MPPFSSCVSPKLSVVGQRRLPVPYLNQLAQTALGFYPPFVAMSRLRSCPPIAFLPNVPGPPVHILRPIEINIRATQGERIRCSSHSSVLTFLAFFSHIHPPTVSVNPLKHGNYDIGQVSPKGVTFAPNVTPVTFVEPENCDVEPENGSLDSDPSSPSSSLFHPALTPAPPSCKCYPPGKCCPAIFHANPMLSCSFVPTFSDKSMLLVPLRPMTDRSPRPLVSFPTLERSLPTHYHVIFIRRLLACSSSRGEAHLGDQSQTCPRLSFRQSMRGAVKTLPNFFSME